MLAWGWLAVLMILSVYLVAAAGLSGEFDFSSGFSILTQPYVLKVLKFTLLQAALSTLISVCMAMPIARAFHRQNFTGKQFLLKLSGICLVIPVIVAILGIVSVHGGKGWIGVLATDLFGIKVNYLYGLSGILIAHVFFNLPLAVRVLIQSLQTVPQSSWRLASHLGMNSVQIFKFIEWPLFRSQLPATAGMIFLLCFTSFAVVLVFGGGLRYSTLEVAIYQALRFDFDVSRAVVLAIVQICVCIVLYLLIVRFSSQFILQTLSQKSPDRHDGIGVTSRLIDVLWLIIFTFLIVLPIGAIVIKGLNPTGWSVVAHKSFYTALAGSLSISLISCLIASFMVMSLSYLSKYLVYSQTVSKTKAAMLDVLVQLILVFPPFVIATGLFISLRKSNLFSAPIIVILVNVLIILPFMMRILSPAILSTNRHDRLSLSLGLSGLIRFKIIDWPVIKKSFALALGVGLALSLGDFSVIALFGTQDFQTLPLYLYRLMGAYKMDQAAVVGLIICLVCLTAFYLSNRLTNIKHA